MTHIKGSLMAKAKSLCGIVDRVAAECVLDHFRPYFRQEMGIGHHGVCRCGKSPHTFPAEETLLVAFIPIADNVLRVTIRTVRF